MTIDDQINDENHQYDINRVAAKISALSSSKIDNYEHLTGEEVLPSSQKEMVKLAKFIYSPIGKAFEKQTKTTEDQAKKQDNSLKVLESSDKKLLINKKIYTKNS